MMTIQVTGWIRVALLFSTLILTGVSIVFTVLLWGSLPDQAWMKWLTGAAGLALELCKFSLLPLSFLMLQQRKLYSGLLLMALGGALFVVSIGASVAFLETGQQQQEQRSLAWQQRQATLMQLDESIRLGQASAAKDIEGGYRQRAGETLETVADYQEQRAQLLKDPVVSDGQLIGIEGDKRFYAWLLLALLIDGCSVAGWSLLASKADESIKVDGVSESLPVVMVDEVTPENDLIDREILRRISNGDYGSKITIRGVMEKERVGYPKIKPVFDLLENDGVIVQGKKGYLLNGSHLKEIYPLL